MEWPIQAIGDIWSSVEVSMDTRGWRITEEGQAHLRKLGIKKSMYDAQLSGTLLTKDLRRAGFNEDLKTGWSFSGFAEPFGEAGPLYEIAKSLMDLYDLDQHINHVYEVLE